MAEQKSIFLIHPPVSLAGEAPAGIARIAGFLGKIGVDCRVVDLNLEGLMGLAVQGVYQTDTWTKRAAAGIDKNLAALRSPDLYGCIDRYKQAVSAINRVLWAAGRKKGVRLSLSNYAEPHRKPVLSSDLADSAADFENNVFFPFFQKRLSKMFSHRSPDIVGISVNFISQALCGAAVAGFVKKMLPEAQIVFGGGLVTSWMQIPGFSNPLPGIVDEMVAGPGETALAAMCVQKEEAPQSSRYDFCGFDSGAYLSPGRILPVSASEGCYWRKCSFCPEKAEKNKYRQYALKDIDVRTGYEDDNQRPALIHFLDNALSPRFLRQLIDFPPMAPWYGFVRATPHLKDPAFAAGLAASGCVMLKIGIESADPAVLGSMGKGTNIETVSRVLRTLASAGIAVYGYLLFGTPSENEAAAVKTRDFVVEHSDCIDFLNLAIFNLPAYSKEAGQLETRPFYGGDLSLYRDFVHPLGWHRDRVRRFLTKNITSVPAIRNIVKNDPPVFTSCHAPFFLPLAGDFGVT